MKLRKAVTIALEYRLAERSELAKEEQAAWFTLLNRINRPKRHVPTVHHRAEAA